MATIKQLVPLDAASLSGVSISPAQAAYLGNTTTAGTVVANAAVTVNSQLNISTIRNITSTGTATLNNVTLNGTLTGGSLSGVSFSGLTFTGTTTINGPITGTHVDTNLSSVTANSVPGSQAVVTYANAAAAAMLDDPILAGTTSIEVATASRTNWSVNTILPWNVYNRLQIQTFSGGDFTFANPSGPTNLILIIDFVGTTTVTLSDVDYWLDGVVPDLSGTATSANLLVCIYYDGADYYASVGDFS